jgi:hypothetical protein
VSILHLNCPLNPRLQQTNLQESSTFPLPSPRRFNIPSKFQQVLSLRIHQNSQRFVTSTTHKIVIVNPQQAFLLFFADIYVDPKSKKLLHSYLIRHNSRHCFTTKPSLHAYAMRRFYISVLCKIKTVAKKLLRPGRVLLYLRSLHDNSKLKCRKRVNYFTFNRHSFTYCLRSELSKSPRTFNNARNAKSFRNSAFFHAPSKRFSNHIFYRSLRCPIMSNN